LVALAGVAPFLIAGFLWHHDDGDLSGLGLLGPCPLLEATGVPCAGCGASRAFYLVTHGEASFTDYNWFWPFFAAAAVLLGIAALGRALRARDPLSARQQRLLDRYRRTPVRMALATGAVFLVPWAVALANADAIRG
jgi:hypothetical protein